MRHEERMSTRFSFIVPVLNDAEGLDRCLRSIRDNDYPSDLLEIVVADNGSSDGSVAVARRHGAIVLELPGLTVAEMRNRAAVRATGDVLAFVDADHAIDAGWLRAAARRLQQPGTGAAGAPYLTAPAGTWVQRMHAGLRRQAAQAVDTAWLASGNLVVWKHVFEKARGFDTNLVTCEDVDFCRRIRALGFRLTNDPALRSVHFGDARTLRELFRGELWRGRDNLRASARERLTWRDVPSVLFPLGFLVSAAGLVTAVLLLPYVGLLPALLALSVQAAIVMLRTAAMIDRARPRTVAGIAQVTAMAATYETARAFALVVRKGHRRARK
jgi:glycosyltransferase involved in cell wall biosynthesis